MVTLHSLFITRGHSASSLLATNIFGLPQIQQPDMSADILENWVLKHWISVSVLKSSNCSSSGIFMSLATRKLGGKLVSGTETLPQLLLYSTILNIDHTLQFLVLIALHELTIIRICVECVCQDNKKKGGTTFWSSHPQNTEAHIHDCPFTCTRCTTSKMADLTSAISHSNKQLPERLWSSINLPFASVKLL